MNEGADKWLGEYETELMQILDTINVAGGISAKAKPLRLLRKQ